MAGKRVYDRLERVFGDRVGNSDRVNNPQCVSCGEITGIDSFVDRGRPVSLKRFRSFWPTVKAELPQLVFWKDDSRPHVCFVVPWTALEAVDINFARLQLRHAKDVDEPASESGFLAYFERLVHPKDRY